MAQEEHVRRQLKEQQQKFSAAGRLASYVTAVTAALALGGSLAAFNIFKESQDSTAARAADETYRFVAQVLEGYDQKLRGEVKDIVTTTFTNMALPEGLEKDLQLVQLETKVDELFSRMQIIDVIETAIQESPERAMSIPMLRRDLTALQGDLRDGNLATRAEIDRIYDLGKWLLGLFGTMAIGILGIATTNLVGRRE